MAGEGNGNPLQCSFLENPRDGGAWWAAIYGVTQSRTRLKRSSSSSSNRRVWQQVLTNMLQYSCLENPLPDREAWQATVYRVRKSQTLPKNPVRIDARLFFACGSSAPVRVEREGDTAAWPIGTLVAPSVQRHRLPPPQELWPYQSLLSSLL